MPRFFMILSFVSLIYSCRNEESSQKIPEELISETPPKTEIKPGKADLSNPVLMYGTDIGTLFKTYYKVGDFASMLRYTDKGTVQRYGKDSLMKIYRKLDLGFDMRLKNMTVEGNEKILHYETQIQATKEVKRLHVVIEDDTARIIPENLRSGDIFE
jgi:hypothetical protein